MEALHLEFINCIRNYIEEEEINVFDDDIWTECVNRMTTDWIEGFDIVDYIGDSFNETVRYEGRNMVKYVYDYYVENYDNTLLDS